jgi:hypothetical protein
MQEDILKSIGNLIIGDVPERDAIHVAVVPVIAATRLTAGQHVSVVKKPERDGLKRVEPCPSINSVGVIDPFLNPVLSISPESVCWLFLKPGSITSLKHVWTHPAFETPEAGPEPESRARAEQWLQNFCAIGDAPPYIVLLEQAIDLERYEDGNLYINGYDCSGPIPPEFYHYLEQVTGVRVPADRQAEFFICSC